MNDARQDVYFLASGQSNTVHRETGMVTNFTRNKDVFEIDAACQGVRPKSREADGELSLSLLQVLQDRAQCPKELKRKQQLALKQKSQSMYDF